MRKIRTKNTAGENNPNYRHGMWGQSIYNRWKHIKQRCYNPNDIGYKYYGGRGIKVCNEWLDKEKGFANFYNWSMQNGYREDLSIDRINNDGNYEPNNCRWTTRKVQNNNTRRLHIITYNNESHTLTEWSKILNINVTTLSNRINYRKMPIKEAFEKNTNRCKKVKQYDLQGNHIRTWKSMNEAAETIGINSNSICTCCKGKRKTAGGYIWRYADEVED